jgi:hypothetical protein
MQMRLVILYLRHVILFIYTETVSICKLQLL